MENKEVEQIIDMFENYQFLGDLQQRKQKVKDHINSLEQQLKAKDKTLDKTCKELAQKGICPKDQGYDYCYLDHDNVNMCIFWEPDKCWKKWAEND